MLATMSAAAGCSLRASLLTHYATHSLGLGSGGYGVLLTAAPADWWARSSTARWSEANMCPWS